MSDKQCYRQEDIATHRNEIKNLDRRCANKEASIKSLSDRMTVVEKWQTWALGYIAGFTGLLMFLYNHFKDHL